MKNWGTGYFITVGLGTLVLSLIFGPNILVQVHFFLQALFFIALFAMTKPKLHKNLVSQLYLLICILGMLVGGYHVLNDNNEVFHYVKYSTIYLTGFLALQIGFSHANKFDTNLINKLAVGICMADLVMFVSRFMVVGLYIRSAWGFTFLLPVAALRNIIRKHEDWIFPLMLLLALLSSALSGMRANFSMTLCMVLFVLYFLPFRRYLALGLIVVLSGIVMATFSDVFQGVIDAAGRSLQIIEVRMRSTLLNESGFRLDPSIGRKEEALAALYAFSEISADISYIFGRGFGYAFDHISYQKYSASTHVHITPVAFFIRNGFIGAFFYAYLFVLLSLCSLKLLFSMNKNRVAFVYAFIALIWITSSTFAGTIVNPVFWWVTGLVLGFSKKRASSGQQIRTRRVNV